jgi:dTDP-4-dehydrorhamnose reductase
VIFDQVGTPTYARDLADAVLRILNVECLILNDTVEIYNFSNEGVTSWYDFAKTIFELSNINCKVNPIETKEYLALNADTPVAKAKEGCPTPAKRPHYSLLNKTKIKKEYNITIPYWKDSLSDCITKIVNDKC